VHAYKIYITRSKQYIYIYIYIYIHIHIYIYTCVCYMGYVYRSVFFMVMQGLRCKEHKIVQEEYKTREWRGGMGVAN